MLTPPLDMAAFHAGDPAAFTHVYHDLYERLYWYGRKFIPEEYEVEDIIHEAFIRAWKRKTEFESHESIRMFLHTVVRNQCLNLIKRRQMQLSRHEEILHVLESQQPGDFFPEQVQAELLRLIFAHVEKLPPSLREVFLLSYQEGLKPAAIAERLQLNVQTVKNRKVTALKILKLAAGDDPLLMAVLCMLAEGTFYGLGMSCIA